eukprot:CAMPEP_0201104574 /NCGR_PEP_ID=MMETSP0812-20130820/39675_1 /ASSEMBLY_ACC=CAM_ASM_000668 /TAXON_ID=98059 /ORGANISM="Dinobryon sp., Strain UTEXLB2267" /LENGTH=69 /DNA_ID=CAMNT_0047363809 /DNA_START=63 /DNA_END=272 /DNA_ORIENTATION=+
MRTITTPLLIAILPGAEGPLPEAAVEFQMTALSIKAEQATVVEKVTMGGYNGRRRGRQSPPRASGRRDQ